MEKKSAIKELGISTAAAAGSGIIGGLINKLFAGSNDRRQIRQQQKLTDMQVTANKQIADYEQELGLTYRDWESSRIKPRSSIK